MTGGAGFLGQYIISALQNHRGDIVARVKKSSDLSSSNGARIDTIYGDIRDPDVIEKAVAGVDILVHAAALFQGSWEDFYSVNVAATQTLN